MKSKISLILIALFFITSCGDKKDNAKDELLKKVMAVHDEIMPKLGDLMEYKKQLNAKIEELMQAGPEENEDQIAKLQKGVEDLENSHEGMMNWMHEFDRKFDSEVQDEVIAYMNDQMTKIEKVGRMTNTAIANAKELLEEQ